MAKFCTESANSIYEMDSVGIGISVHINSLKATFINKKDSFSLNIDNFKATKFNDTIINFDDLNIPACNMLFGIDTTRAIVTCEYFLIDSLITRKSKCLFGQYFIYKNSILLENKYVSCE